MEEILEMEMSHPHYDVVVIGGGAAGLMAAGTAAKVGNKVLLLEKMEKPARKVRITGKGRCNLTNARPVEEFGENVRTNAEWLNVAMSEFTNRSTMRFFERMGVKLVTERGERVFPASGKAADIANALEFYCRDYDVEIQCNSRVTEILVADGKVYGLKYMNKRGFVRKIEVANVIIATGGVSYPATGSTGDGYTFADRVGHKIEDVRPSLTPLVSNHPQIEYIKDVWLKNINARLFVAGEMVREEFGEMSFSDRGLEGAVILRLSRDAVDALLEEKSVKIELDLKPALTEDILRERLKREIAEMQPSEFFSELLRKLVPKQMVVPLAKEVDFHSKTYVGKLTDTEKMRLVKILKGMAFPISDYAPFQFAIVTAGGVDCSEVNKYTMESTLVKGLYFAGEVLDVDANTGGYNMQIAFSTGRLAGQLKK